LIFVILLLLVADLTPLEGVDHEVYKGEFNLSHPLSQCKTGIFSL